jgi:hypothetical protein
MSRYKYTTVVGCILDTKQNVSFIEGAPNWEEYQKWLMEGNTTDPTDPVVVTKEMIKAEAQRRILARLPYWKQSNYNAKMNELNMLHNINGSWTAEEQAIVDYLKSEWLWAEGIRNKSDELELSLPEDYQDDEHWPIYPL